jgi:hypothetical protein
MRRIAIYYYISKAVFIKKSFSFKFLLFILNEFVPGCHEPNSPWLEIIKLFPPRESWVSDIPAGDGKIANLCLQCTILF